MRYPGSEKLEIIRIVEQSHLPTRKTLEQLGIPRRTFCRWYDRYLEGGPEALEDRPSAPSRVWNRTPANIHDHEPPTLKWSAPIVRKAENQEWRLRDPSPKRLS